VNRFPIFLSSAQAGKQQSTPRLEDGSLEDFVDEADCFFPFLLEDLADFVFV
jgi:hypothetical protein